MDKSLFDKYKAFIFDLDGTLIDSMPYHIKAWSQAGEAFNLKIEEDFINACAGASSLDIANKLVAKGFDIDPQQLVELKVKKYRENIGQIKLFENIGQYLKQAHIHNLKTAVATGTQRINAEDILNILNLRSYVDQIVSCDDVSMHKPHPQTFIKAAELLGLNANECLVFEDGEFGLQAAKAGKFDCVYVQNDKIITLHKYSTL